MTLTRRALLALVGTLPFIKALSAHPAPAKPRYHAAAYQANSHDGWRELRIELTDHTHAKQWVATMRDGYRPQDIRRAMFENLKLSILRRAEDETPDFDRVAAQCELMKAMLPHHHRA
jgi:hypothetical protein